jgi:hypothetical protein
MMRDILCSIAASYVGLSTFAVGFVVEEHFMNKIETAIRNAEMTSFRFMAFDLRILNIEMAY